MLRSVFAPGTVAPTVLFSSALLATFVTAAPRRTLKPSPGTAAIRARYGQLPLVFEENRGQAPAETQFLSRGPGYTLRLAGNGGALRLSAGRNAKRTELAWSLRGAGPAVVHGEQRLPGESHYLRGASPQDWHLHVPQFAQVRYASVLPGVDLLYYGSHSQLEYDFRVAPHADPAAIRMEYRGARAAHVRQNGDLVFETTAGDLVQPRPVIYQQVGGQRWPVEGSFTVVSNGSRQEVGFRLGAYDRSRELVIDPVLEYSTRLGGSTGDAANAIAVDGNGNAFVTGETDSVDFPTTSGVFQHNPQGGTSSNEFDAFVTKLNADGSQVLYSTYLGGAGDETGYGIAVDANGRAVVTGSTTSGDFPTTANAFRTTFAGGDHDGFVAKLKPDGSGLVFSSLLGGFLDDICNAVALDSQGRIWVAGQTNSQNFPLTANAAQGTSGGLGFNDGFVSELKADGSELLYSSYLGGSDDDFATGLAVDRDDSVYVAGSTNSGDFPITNGALKTQHASNDADAFVTKLNSSGQVAYSTYLGGNNGDEDQVTVAVDRRRTAFVLGRTTSSNYPVLNAYQKSYKGYADLFVSRLDAQGAHLLYSTFLGGTKAEKAGGIAVDLGGNAFVVGSSLSEDFPVSSPVSARSLQQDAVIAELDPTGKLLTYSTYLGGTGTDAGRAIAVDQLGTVYAAGKTASTNFPTTIGAFSRNQGQGWIASVIGDIPAAPSALTAKVINRSEVDLAWKDNSTNEAAFEVSASTDGTSFVVLSLVPANTTTYAATGLQASQPYTFRVRAVNSGGGSAPIDVAATPTASGKLNVSPASLNFGSLTHGGQPRVKSFKIKNSGAGDLNVTIGTPTVSAFTVQPFGAQTVAAGKSIQVQVSFSPAAAGTFTDVLQITSDARTNSTAKVKLKGVGK